MFSSGAPQNVFVCLRFFSRVFFSVSRAPIQEA